MDELKKQIQSLTVRIEQARANLAIQTKYRDAAVAMTKLYNSGKRATVDPKAAETAMEMRDSERRCEELAAELFELEKSILEPQRKLFQHTAGILQLTHRASSKKNPPAGLMLNGVPGSPDSLYTYTNGRNSLQFSSDDLDDRSLYFPLDDSDSPKTDITIPPRSPVRQQTNQLRDEVEKLKKQSAGHVDVISKTEQDLGDLNNRLRTLIIQVDPAKNANYKPVPSGAAGSGGLVSSQLEYLTEALSVIQEGQQAQQLRVTDSVRKSDNTAASLRQAEQRLGDLNRQVHDLLVTNDAEHPAPPEVTGLGLDEHLTWTDRSLPALRMQLERSTASAAGAQQTEQIESVLTGLWEIIQSGYADIYRQREARKQVRLGKGLPDDDDDVSADESFDFTEAYSLTAFSAKVQWLFRQATGLKEQKSVLKRQIRQQRELNSRSDGEKDVDLKNKVEELQRTKSLLAFSEESALQAKAEAEETQAKLAKALADLDTLQNTQTANNVAAASVAQDQLRERNAKVTSLEADNKALQDKLEIVEAQLGAMSEQLRDVDTAKEGTDDTTRKLEEEIKAKDEELEQLNIMMIELKTELTIAKAELEGAYGSRSERAAEAAALTKSQQMVGMQTQIDKLKEELAATVKELEDLTKETLSSEKEKIELEGRLDAATASRNSLENELGTLRERYNTEVTKLKEQLDEEKFKAGPNSAGTGPRAGASMLSEQFRATMKEERKKFRDELKVCLNISRRWLGQRTNTSTGGAKQAQKAGGRATCAPGRRRRTTPESAMKTEGMTAFFGSMGHSIRLLFDTCMACTDILIRFRFLDISIIVYRLHRRGVNTRVLGLLFVAT